MLLFYVQRTHSRQMFSRHPCPNEERRFRIMPSNPLSDIQACVFDAYGTLFDVHSAVSSYGTTLGKPAGSISNLWRRKQLEYTWLRSLMGRHVDFWRVTEDALKYALAEHDIQDNGLQAQLMQAYLRLECYPDVYDTLGTIRRLGLRTAILSNGSPSMLDAVVSNAGIENLLDEVFSIEDVGIYKPSTRVYDLACDRLALAPAQVCFQSTNAWDVAGAVNFGLHVVWVNRFNQRAEALDCVPDYEIQSLAELSPLLSDVPTTPPSSARNADA